MPKNCLVEYLTDHCATCPDWKDGTNGSGIGCGTHFPIMRCPHFAKMYEESERQRYGLNKLEGENSK
jgi:hypothetical protein